MSLDASSDTVRSSRRRACRRADGEPSDAPPPQPPPTQVQSRADQENLVAHHPRYERRLRVVDQDALPLIDPCVGGGEPDRDELPSQGIERVAQQRFPTIENL